MPVISIPDYFFPTDINVPSFKKELLLSQHSHSSCYPLASTVLHHRQRKQVPWALMESAVPEGQHAVSPENLWMCPGTAVMAVHCCRHDMHGPNWIHLAHQLLDLSQGHASQLPCLTISLLK